MLVEGVEQHAEDHGGRQGTSPLHRSHSTAPAKRRSFKAPFRLARYTVRYGVKVTGALAQREGIAHET